MGYVLPWGNMSYWGAQVIVNLENRHVVEILRVGFFQYRALADGRIDPEHSREVMATVHEAAFGWLQLTKPPPGVVDAECKFAERRLHHMSAWKPTQGELSKLRSLGPARLVLSLGPEPRLEPAKVMRLVQRKDSRWKLT